MGNVSGATQEQQQRFCADQDNYWALGIVAPGGTSEQQGQDMYHSLATSNDTHGHGQWALSLAVECRVGIDIAKETELLWKQFRFLDFYQWRHFAIIDLP